MRLGQHYFGTTQWFCCLHLCNALTQSSLRRYGVLITSTRPWRKMKQETSALHNKSTWWRRLSIMWFKRGRFLKLFDCCVGYINSRICKHFSTASLTHVYLGMYCLDILCYLYIASQYVCVNFKTPLPSELLQPVTFVIESKHGYKLPVYIFEILTHNLHAGCGWKPRQPTQGECAKSCQWMLLICFSASVKV